MTFEATYSVSDIIQSIAIILSLAIPYSILFVQRKHQKKEERIKIRPYLILEKVNDSLPRLTKYYFGADEKKNSVKYYYFILDNLGGGTAYFFDIHKPYRININQEFSTRIIKKDQRIQLIFHLSPEDSFQNFNLEYQDTLGNNYYQTYSLEKTLTGDIKVNNGTPQKK